MWLCAALALLQPYTIEKGPDETLAAGSKGSLELRIVLKGERYFLPPDAPLLVKLFAEGDVAVERSLLKREDAVDPRPGERARQMTFRIPVAATQTGARGAVRAEILFYVGTVTWSREVRETARWNVTVKK
jgi:hypothetical protein